MIATLEILAKKLFAITFEYCCCLESSKTMTTISPFRGMVSEKVEGHHSNQMEKV